MKRGGIFDLATLQQSIHDLTQEFSSPHFWDDRAHAEQVSTKLARLKTKQEQWQKLRTKIVDLEEICQLLLEEPDSSLTEEIAHSYQESRQRYYSLRIQELLNEEYDAGGTFLTIHAGAGGTEACDWVRMLQRMYLRWCERHAYKIQTLDLQEAEGGIKSTTIQIEGEYSYGYLKGESGVHRLVRISPFDSSSRRHTTFASVAVAPIVRQDVEIALKPSDIRVDTYRASGAGGQHVNKTDSAVRITHLATGIVAQCQNERSQHMNKESALRILTSRLYQLRQEEQRQRQQNLQGEKKDIAWGNQIRSYVFQPYTMVKDHRLNQDTGNIRAVMDGEIDRFIESYLNQQWEEN